MVTELSGLDNHTLAALVETELFIQQFVDV